MKTLHQTVVPIVATLALLGTGCASLSELDDAVSTREAARANAGQPVTGSNIWRSASPVHVIDEDDERITRGATAQDILTGGRR